MFIEQAPGFMRPADVIKDEKLKPFLMIPGSQTLADREEEGKPGNAAGAASANAFADLMKKFGSR